MCMSVSTKANKENDGEKEKEKGERERERKRERERGGNCKVDRERKKCASYFFPFNPLFANKNNG